MASTEKSLRNNKNQNIQVFVRLRPLNQRERAIRSLGVVEVVNSREVVVRQSQQTSHTKKFTFDRAFGPNTEQVEVYKDVVSPLIAEVLAGYNCTVFAYGQTGTGKTHTMVGESSGEGTTWQNDPLAGIIPRALSQLFDELRISNAEYTVRVSYLELYNEELFDLLSSSEDNSKLRIYEDVTRKGSTIVNGLEEITVYNKNEVYEIMSQGQERKKVASTLMNAQSSRSHTVFTIVVHMKENCPKGEELVKIGKLNLVDLAGSENISKAGSDNPAKKERARECVNINQSLLTLGRVITALVEKHPHIPYRESKLTRILQESLGGRTKTSIIATVSPGHKDLEETMSTLEYAHRAKNIQNKPEVNQKLTKQAILKDFAEEIDKLKRELTATREKNGVYLPTEAYEELMLSRDDHRREIQELLLKKRALEDQRERMEQVFTQLDQRCARTEEELLIAKEELERTTTRLVETEQQCAEREHLLGKHLQTEGQLTMQAQQLVAVADDATGDAGCLHDTVERRRTVESTNEQLVREYRAQATALRDRMVGDVQQCAECFTGERDRMQADIDDHARDTSLAQETNIQDMKILVAKMGAVMNEVTSMTEEGEKQVSAAAGECIARVQGSGAGRREALRGVLAQLAQQVAACAARAADADVAGTVQRSTEHWVKEAGARVQCLQSTHAAHDSSARALEGRRGEAARAHHAQRIARLRARDQAISACITELEKDKQAIEERITQQVSLMESERMEAEARLQRWLEQERAALAGRMEKYSEELDKHKRMLAACTERCVRMQQLQLEANREEMEMAEAYLQQCGSENQESLKSADEFDKEFGEGTSAISAELEAFGCSVVQVVEHASAQLLGEVRAAHACVEEGVNSVLASDSEATQQCAEATEAAAAGVVAAARHNFARVAETIAESSTSTMETLSGVITRTTQLSELSMQHQSAQTQQLSRAAQCVQRLGEDVRAHADRMADAEGRYLMKEYRVYTPSGNTPARREYRYPRRLVATSPHERILARFRAAQQRDREHSDSPDSDCIVVESDEGRQTSDSDVSESSVSEDSAVAMQ